MSSFDNTLLQIYRLLLESIDIYDLLPEILDLVIEGANAERGQIELYDDTGERCFLKARKDGRDIEDRRESPISRKILAWVKETNEIVLSADAAKDGRFLDQAAAALGQNVLSAACVPLRDERGAFGVLYLDNCSCVASFNEETKNLLEELATRLAAPLRKKIKQDEDRKCTPRELRQLCDRKLGYVELIGDSPAIQEVLDKIEFSKDRDENVLILGESGTGKELAARLLHHKSIRAGKKFIAFDCSAVPEEILISELFGHEKGTFTGAVQRQTGLVEEAEGGTLLLDEIGNLSVRVQAMLLRFLDHKQYRRLGAGEERPANVRLMFATNKDLASLVQKREFREDLYFRLKRGVVLHVPPLRERREDILHIADYLLKKFNRERGAEIYFSVEAHQALMDYSYPGNIRELESFVYEAAYFALRAGEATIQLSHLPKELLIGSEVSFAEEQSQNHKLSPNDFYVKYLPKELQDRHFIWGRLSEPENGFNSVYQLHDQLVVSIKPALGMSLKHATRAVAHAFERNVLIALLQQTNGKQREAISLAGINKSAFINKIKRHGIQTRKNQFEKDGGDQA